MKFKDIKTYILLNNIKFDEYLGDTVLSDEYTYYFIETYAKFVSKEIGENSDVKVPPRLPIYSFFAFGATDSFGEY